jgi:hypothetical protein
MKIMRSKQEMVIFLCFLLIYSYAIKQPKSNVTYTISESDLDDLDDLVLLFKREQSALQPKIDSYKTIIKQLSNNNPKKAKELNQGFKLIENEYARAKTQTEKLSKYVLDFTKELNISRTQDIKGFESYRKKMEDRKRNGLSAVNKLLRTFLFKEETGKNLDDLQNIFEPGQKNKNLKNTKPSQNKKLNTTDQGKIRGRDSLYSKDWEKTNSTKQKGNKNKNDNKTDDKRSVLNSNEQIEEDKDEKGYYLRMNSESKTEVKLQTHTENKLETQTDTQSQTETQTEISTDTIVKSQTLELSQSQTDLEKGQKFRIWSSFRLEETVNNLFIQDAKGEDVIRAALVSVMSSVPPAFCWVHESKLAITDVDCNGNLKRKGTICLNQCDEDQVEVGGLCMSKCSPDQQDCDLFCSNSDCNSPQDFVPKTSLNREIIFTPRCPKGYYRKGNLCFPSCEQIGMVSCSERTCALSKALCKAHIPDIPKNIVRGYVNFLGHIYSIRSNKDFGWSDPKNLEQSMSIMDSFYQGNLDAFKEMFKIFLKMLTGKAKNLFDQVDRNVEKMANSFFKNKDNKPLSLMFKWADFSKLFKKFFMNILGSILNFLFAKKKARENFDVCEMKKFSKQCFVRFEKFIFRMTPFYLLGLLSRFAKPVCPFDLNFV